MSRQSKLALKKAIEDHRPTLLRTLGLYLQKAGLASPGEVQAAAEELLHDVVIEALATAGRYDTTRSAQAWLLGIAANLIKRRQDARYKQQRREPLARDLYDDENLSDDDLFDFLAASLPDNDPATAWEQQEQSERLRHLLATLAVADQEIIELALYHEMDGVALARHLGIKPGAARVRLHRALNRLRTAAGEVHHEKR